jgi:Fur family transcriptional regulator, ferric uptake regulator
MTEKLVGAILRRSGLKKTAGRLALLSVLTKTDKPLSHKDICAALDYDFCYDPVSVYRSLESFVEAGFVHKIEDENRTWLFALCTCGEKSHCHPHFFCRSCGKCECLKNLSIPVIENLQDGYVVEEQRYYIHGICSACSAARDNRSV